MTLHKHTESKDLDDFLSQAELLHSEIKMIELTNLDLPYCEQIPSRSFLLSACFNGHCWLLVLLSQRSEREKLASAIVHWATVHEIISRQKSMNGFLLIKLQGVHQKEVFRMCEQLSSMFEIRCD